MTNQEKFQALLRDLFQFDCSDLDFGIYRIMNYKRDVIEKFISTDLPELIGEELNRDALAGQSQAAAQLAETAQEIAKTLGKDALDADGNLVQFQETEIGKQYLSLQGKAAGGRGREALEAAIFNHLYTFFSRYYQDGDFISKRRYSKRQKYAIPYNGEEVYLHWANHDQYYIKTAEHFHDYTFTSQGVTVHFKLTAANVEQNNIKGDKRFFLPRVKEIDWRENANELVIPFEYRPLTEQEKVNYGRKNQQDKISAGACEAIPKHLKKADKALAAIIAERRKDSDNQPVTFLAHHLRQYTRKNTSDFFIHKDLRGFLARELDFYLKNEVLNLDEIEAAGEGRSEGWFQILRVIKAVGSRIIDFLDQIESFQKMLWEKRKFVTETHYCITVGTIDERFYPEIAACDAQWDEWKELFHIDEEHSDLFSKGKSKRSRRIEYLKAHPTLVLDTKHFSASFVDALLASFGDVDSLTDGILVNSENFQALALLQERYRASATCIYIDPPYNTDAAPIVYKNGYPRSSWAALMHDRVILGRRLLSESGILCATIDDFQYRELQSIISRVYGEALVAGTVVIRSNPSGRPVPEGFGQAHEYAIFARAAEAATIGRLPRSDKQARRYSKNDEKGRFMWELYRKRGSGSERSDRPTMYYPIYASKDRLRVPDMEWDDNSRQWKILEEPSSKETEVWPIDENGTQRRWRGKWDRVNKTPSDFRAKRDETGQWTVYYKFRPSADGVLPTTAWIDSKYSATEHGTGTMRDLFSEYHVFDYPKSIYAVRDCLQVGNLTSSGNLVIDYFAGSGTTGHAVIQMNRNDGERRRFVLVEMEKYFERVLLTRLKKVVFSPTWKDGKPVGEPSSDDANRNPRIIKYLRLESYEDSLNNIDFDKEGGQGALTFDDYLIQYMLKWETRKSDTFLNVAQLTNPFSYKLTVANGDSTVDKVVDLPETFNYLLGLHVIKRKVYDDDGRRYLVYHGRVDHRLIAVIWRETEDWEKADLERDKKFVAAQKLAEGADEVFVNGDSFIPNAKALEPVFKARMFAPLEA